jgi:hypothetical protein
MNDNERLRWSPFRQWAEARQAPEPEPEQPETDLGPITADPDQGRRSGTHLLSMSDRIRKAAGYIR